MNNNARSLNVSLNLLHLLAGWPERPRIDLGLLGVASGVERRVRGFFESVPAGKDADVRGIMRAMRRAMPPRDGWY